MDPQYATLIGVLVIILLSIGPGIAAWKDILGGRRNVAVTPQPFEVTAAKSYMTKEDCDKRMVENTGSHRTMHQKHEDLATEVAALGATVELNGARLVQMDGKLDRLLERY